MPGSSVDRLIEVFRNAIELVVPDLRKHHRMVRKAEVVTTYASDGSYWADVQPLLNDETPDPDEGVVGKVEIPVLWGGPERGVVCPPAVGTLCDLSYYNGDQNYPRISNFRWKRQKAPACEVGAFIIQLEPGVSIEIEADKRIVTLTSADVETEAGGRWTVKATGEASIDAAKIKLNGGAGVVTRECKCHFTGAPHGDASTTVFAGV